MDAASVLAWLAGWGAGLVSEWGYLGIFVISVASSATIILPVPSFAIIFAAGAVMNPFLVGLVGGAGSAIGELTGYAVGAGGKRVLKSRHEKLLKKTESWAEKRGFFAVIVVFAATPLPDDITGILGGAIGYDIRKFFAAALIGKLALNLALAFGGYYGYSWMLSVLGGA